MFINKKHIYDIFRKCTAILWKISTLVGWMLRVRCWCETFSSQPYIFWNLTRYWSRLTREKWEQIIIFTWFWRDSRRGRCSFNLKEKNSKNKYSNINYKLTRIWCHIGIYSRLFRELKKNEKFNIYFATNIFVCVSELIKRTNNEKIWKLLDIIQVWDDSNQGLNVLGGKGTKMSSVNSKSATISPYMTNPQLRKYTIIQK